MLFVRKLCVLPKLYASTALVGIVVFPFSVHHFGGTQQLVTTNKLLRLSTMKNIIHLLTVAYFLLDQ